MVPVDSDRIPRVPPYSGYRYNIQTLRVRDYHPLRSNFPIDSTSFYILISRSYNPNIAETILVWAIPLSLATTQRIDFSFFSCRYLDVSVPCVDSSYDVTGLQPAGLPHSDICGSNLVCKSPQLFAAYHVLLRP